MNKEKILIVEDEAIIAMDIKNIIVKLNYIVTNVVSNTQDVINSIKDNEPDIILMDIDLDGNSDGIQTVELIHCLKYIPVIYLTGFYDDETISRAIQTNPVGYLLKPFSKDELKVAILIGLSKSTTFSEDNSLYKKYKHLGFDYYFDEVNKKLYDNGYVIKLGQKEIKLLNILVEANQESVSFETIIDEIYKDAVVSNDTVRTLVYRLRRKLNYKLISSVPFFGFKL